MWSSMVVVFLIECDATVQGVHTYIYLKTAEKLPLSYMFLPAIDAEFCQFNKLHEGFSSCMEIVILLLSSNLLIKGFILQVSNMNYFLSEINPMCHWC